MPDANQVKFQLILSHAITTAAWPTTSMELTFRLNGNPLLDARQDKFLPTHNHAMAITRLTILLTELLEPLSKLSGNPLLDAKKVKFLLILNHATETTRLTILSTVLLETSSRFNTDHQSSALRDLTETQSLATTMILLLSMTNLSQRMRMVSLQQKLFWVAQRSTTPQERNENA